MSDKVTLNINLSTLAVLISGLYLHHTGIAVEAIPASLFIEVAEQLALYLPTWDYNRLSFEDWIANYLIIAPKEMFTEDEIKDMRSEDIYLERILGNVTLIASAKVNV